MFPGGETALAEDHCLGLKLEVQVLWKEACFTVTRHLSAFPQSPQKSPMVGVGFYFALGCLTPHPQPGILAKASRSFPAVISKGLSSVVSKLRRTLESPGFYMNSRCLAPTRTLRSPQSGVTLASGF